MKRIVTLALITLAFGVSAMAAEGNLAKENAMLKQRLAKMEGELGQIKSMLNAGRTVKAAPKGTASASNLLKGVKIYGYTKLDMSWNSHSASNGGVDVTREIEGESSTSAGGNNSDEEFGMTARQSRLGFALTGPESDNLKTRGKIEVDFYGGADTSSLIRMRHAYGELLWVKQDISLLAGQTWHLMSQLNPSTINFNCLGNSGNLWGRAAQLRVTKGFSLNKDSRLEIAAALADPTGADNEGSGMPVLEGSVSYETPLWTGRKAKFILSGHVGEEESEIFLSTGALREYDYITWSANFGMVLPITKQLTLSGEVYIGENLNEYGSTNGGVNETNANRYYAEDVNFGAGSTDRHEIGSQGGWVNLQYKPMKKWTFNVGAGLDDADDADLDEGNVSRNYTMYLNANYAINSAVTVGVEYSHFETEYYQTDSDGVANSMPDGDADRIQVAFTYKF